MSCCQAHACIELRCKIALTGNHYYWRQLKDMKGSLNVVDLDKAGFETYLRVCAVCLARVHALTGDAAGISGCMGKGKALAKAFANFAVACADQTESDLQALLEAIESGRKLRRRAFESGR